MRCECCQLDVLKGGGRLSFLPTCCCWKRDLREVVHWPNSQPSILRVKRWEVPTDSFAEELEDCWDLIYQNSDLTLPSAGGAGLNHEPLHGKWGTHYSPCTAGKQSLKSLMTGIDAFDNVLPELRFLNKKRFMLLQRKKGNALPNPLPLPPFLISFTCGYESIWSELQSLF